VAVPRSCAHAGQSPGRGLHDQFAAAVERRSYRRGQRDGKPPASQDHDDGKGQDTAAPAGKNKRRRSHLARGRAAGHWAPAADRGEPASRARGDGLRGVPAARRRAPGPPRQRPPRLRTRPRRNGLQVTAPSTATSPPVARGGHETVASPGVGLCSQIEGRKRDLQLSERCLVGRCWRCLSPPLALRFRLSRLKVGGSCWTGWAWSSGGDRSTAGITIRPSQ